MAALLTLAACAGTTAPVPNAMRPEIPAAADGSARFVLSQRFDPGGRRATLSARGRIALDDSDGEMTVTTKARGRTDRFRMRLVDGVVYRKVVDPGLGVPRGWRRVRAGSSFPSFRRLGRSTGSVVRHWRWTGGSSAGGSALDCYRRRRKQSRLVDEVCVDGAGRPRQVRVTGPDLEVRFDIVAFAGPVHVDRPAHVRNGGTS